MFVCCRASHTPLKIKCYPKGQQNKAATVKHLDTDHADEEAKEAHSDVVPSTKTRSNLLTVSGLVKR